MKQQMIMKCPACQESAPMRHLHSTAHGVPGTHMDGSERFECSNCGHMLTRDDAESRGLEYTLDK